MVALWGYLQRRPYIFSVIHLQIRRTKLKKFIEGWKLRKKIKYRGVSSREIFNLFELSNLNLNFSYRPKPSNSSPFSNLIHTSNKKLNN